MPLARSETQPDLRLFDEAESELVARALIALSQISPTDAAVLSRLMSQLADLNHLISVTPSLRHAEALGGERAEELDVDRPGFDVVGDGVAVHEHHRGARRQVAGHRCRRVGDLLEPGQEPDQSTVAVERGAI